MSEIRKRAEYRKGATALLAGMKVGEKYWDDGRFNWRSLQAIAARLEKYLNLEVEYVFRSNKTQGKSVVRVR